MKDLIKALKNVPNEYKSVPFWSWNNFLDEEELVKQIERMYADGIGRFIMHARTGLKEEYLGEKWFSCVGACLKKARELGMNAWIYDENGWPSGFVGGKLLENEAFRARYLEYEVGEYDEKAFAVFIKEADRYRRVEQKAGDTDYYNIYLRVSPANSDILNPDVVDAFLRETHEKYYERFSGSFGKELTGFFTDEPQYYRWATPYTPVAEAEFSKSGEDIRDGLIWLFVHDERGYEFRLKYYGILNKLYCENFYKKLYDWCEAHGCLLTGHSVEEGALFAQMYGGAAVMPTYEYEHIPAIDWLGRDCGSPLAPKQVASVAAQLGKKFILTETYGCAGYDVTPRELKSIGDFQYFNGVTTMCQHLYPYSVAGRGKTDHPPVFSPHGNWGEGFQVFNEYFNRLGYLIANTQEQCDVAVLHPVRDIWLDYVRSEDYESVKETETGFQKLLDFLTANGVTFHLIDEGMLEKYGSAEDGALRVGRCVYTALILPDLRTLRKPTYRILKEYSGKLLVLSQPRYLDGREEKLSLCSNITEREIIEGRKIRFSCGDGRSFMTHRKGFGTEFVFLKNNSRTQESTVRLEEDGFVSLNLETFATEGVEETIVLGAGEGLVLARGKSLPRKKRSAKDVTNNFAVTGMSENYFVLDYAAMAKQNKEFGVRRAVSGLFEDLLREDYKGEVFIKQTFVLKETMPLTLIMENSGFRDAALNGKKLAFRKSGFDVNFREADITEFVREGENEFVYALNFYQHEGVRFALYDPQATESLRNCLYYDTSLETAYLRGNFTVNADFSLQRAAVQPSLGSDLYRKGYPFFKGELTAAGTVAWSEKGKAILSLEGRYHVAELYINGNYAPLVLDTKRDVTPFMKKGENEVKIVVRSSLRNLFGPHHFRPEPEPMGVSPYHFEFRGCWKAGEEPNDYTSAYYSVPFGIDKIILFCEE